MYRVPPLGRALLALAALTALLSSSARAASRTIVYIGADDCKPCRQWEAMYQRSFMAKCAARGVGFRAVRVPTLRNIRDMRYWPRDLRPLLMQFPDRSGTPHFLAVRDGEVIVNVHGISRYRSDIATLMEPRR